MIAFISGVSDGGGASSNPFESVDNFVGYGVAGVVLWFVGRQMVRLWGAWGDFAAVSTARSAADETRADELQRELTACQVELAECRVRCEYQEREVARLAQVVGEVVRDRPPDADGPPTDGEGPEPV